MDKEILTFERLTQNFGPVEYEVDGWGTYTEYDPKDELRPFFPNTLCDCKAQNNSGKTALMVYLAMAKPPELQVTSALLANSHDINFLAPLH